MLQVDDIQLLTYPDVSNLTILQIHHLIRMLYDRSRITGDIEIQIILTHTNDQRTRLASSHQMARVILLDNGNGIRTDGIVQSLTNGRNQVLAILLIVEINQLHQHLGIGSTFKLIALLDELFLQYLVVLDDTIMHQRQVTAHAHMRMGVGSRRLTMGSPAGMGDTHMTAAILLGSHRLQVAHLTLCLIHIQLILTVYQCHAGTVISTILQFLQALDEDRIGIILTNISNYSTHNFVTSFINLLFFDLFLPIQESHDEQDLFLPLITQSHRLLLAIGRMALGETTKYLINTNTPLRFVKGIYQIEHPCLITGTKRLRMFRQPKVEFTFTLFVHKSKTTVYFLKLYNFFEL